MPLVRTALSLVCAALVFAAAGAADWPELRGPRRDGTTTGTQLPDAWAPSGRGPIWRAPVGGISGAVVLGDRVCLQGPVEPQAPQERVVCLDANTGMPAWEKRLIITHSDATADAVGSATPALDPETGHVYALTAGGVLAAFTRGGVPLWTRDLVEEFGLVVPADGHLASPIVDGRDVIVSGVTAGVSGRNALGHRFLAFDKLTGDVVWLSVPGAEPHGSSASPAMITEVDGTRILVAAASDGVWYGINAGTGERIWRYEIGGHAITTGAIRVGANLILSDAGADGGGRPGVLIAIDAAARGELTERQARWVQRGFAGGSSSPFSDGRRIYWFGSNGALAAFDPATGKRLWVDESLRPAAFRADALFADGKIYVGADDGRFAVLRVRADGCDIVGDTNVESGGERERISARPAASDGRLYVVTSKATYAIGNPAGRAAAWAPPTPAPANAAAETPASLQIVPSEAAAYPGQTLIFHVRVVDARGHVIREEGRQPLPQTSASNADGSARQPQAGPAPAKSDLAWSIAGLGGSVQPDGVYVVPAGAAASSATLRASLGALSSDAQLRVVPPRWSMSFDDEEIGTVPRWWIAARGVFAVRAAADGSSAGATGANKVLAKSGGLAFPARAFAGLRTSTNYTIECDIRLARGEMGRGGVLGQGYDLSLDAQGQQLRLQSWQGNPARSKSAAMPIAAGTWYRLKLRVEPLIDGSVRTRGKAWRAGEPEPAAWAVEQTDPPGIGPLIGAPGLAADGAGEVLFDNVAVTPN